MVKLQTPSLQLCQKNEPHYWYFSSNLSSSKEPLLQSRPQRKKSQFWNWMDIMLLNVSCSLFSAVAVCTLKWWMVNLLRNKEESFDLIPFAFECKHQRIHENYKVKTHSGNCSAWYIKTIWKLQYHGKCSAWYIKTIWVLQYQFSNAQINWL